MSASCLHLDIGQPNARQDIALRATNRYVGYGGARGGGKSWVIRAKTKLLAFALPGIKIAIFRRSNPELQRNHIDFLCAELVPKFGSYNEQKKRLTLFNGSIIFFCYCENEKDTKRYQGLEVDVLFIDEATQITEEVFKRLNATVRGPNSFIKRTYLTANPGGIGHAWFKRLFVDRQFKMKPDGEYIENPEDYVFIPAKLTDNDALMKMDPDYIHQLEALPPKLRAAWLDGDWNLFDGQFFEEFTDDPEHYKDRRWTHVIEPFEPDRSWPIYRSYDWGYARPFSCAWWAVDHHGRLYRILEYYGCVKDSPNEGIKLTTEEQFENIASLEREHPWLRKKHIQGVADPAIWAESGGISTAEVAARKGVFFEKGDNQRVPGWMQMHYRFRFDERGFPMMYIFKNCTAFIRTIPTLIYDENKPEDLDTTGEDHVADESRYMCMLSPIAPPVAIPEKPKVYNPLGDDDGNVSRYNKLR